MTSTRVLALEFWAGDSLGRAGRTISHVPECSPLPTPTPFCLWPFSPPHGFTPRGESIRGALCGSQSRSPTALTSAH